MKVTKVETNIVAKPKLPEKIKVTKTEEIVNIKPKN